MSVVIGLALLVHDTQPSTRVVVASDVVLDVAKARAALGVYTQITEVVLAGLPTDNELQSARQMLGKALELQRAADRAALELRYDEAIAGYEEALVAFTSGAAALDSFEPVSSCWIRLANAYLNARHDLDANRALKFAVVLNPGVRPDPAIYPPRLIHRFREAEGAVMRRPRSTVTVLSEPAGAAVVIDGRNIGTAPVSVDGLLEGEHWVLVYAPGYRRFTTRAKVEQEARVEAYLRPVEAGANELETRPAKLVATALLAKEAPLLDAYTALATKEAQERKVEVIATVAKEAGGLRMVVWEPAQQAKSILRAGDVESLFGLLAQRAQGQPAQPASLSAAPKNLEPRAHTHLALALMPFGIGQFVEGRPLAGALFLSSQVALLAFNIISYVLVSRSLQADGTSLDGNRDRILRALNITSFALLLGDVLGGSIEGAVRR